MSLFHPDRKPGFEARRGAPSLVEIAIIVAGVLAACLAGIASGSFTSI